MTTHLCPACNRQVSLGHFVCQSGAKGGLTKGATKARDPQKMALAGKQRWKNIPLCSCGRRAIADGVKCKKCLALI